MKSSTFALTAIASIAGASAESVFFSAQSSDNSINGPISSIHEGAGFNYFLVGTAGSSGEVFNLTDGVASNYQGTYPAYVGIFGSYLSAGPAVTPSTLTFDDNVVTNNNFWACKNTGDPYSYSASSYVIAVSDKGNNTAPFASCTPVTILKNAAGSSSSSSSASSATSESSVTSAVSSSAVSSSSGWSNSTTTSTGVTIITTGTTVTEFTTFCPASTVITITTCSKQECAPCTLTVTEPGTVTVTGSIVVPTTVTAPPGPTFVTSSTKSTVAAQSTPPSVTTAKNGAAKVAVGAAGFAGAVAMLI